MKTEAATADSRNRACKEEQQQQQEEEEELRRGPWTLEEDTLLIHYVACHGEGRWNLLAKSAGLKRTGKSCRLRWLNYLKPDIKRGNLTAQEQLMILELHSKLGNRWSKIAAHLPGRTDNEIKNYWRTRVQKQARQLNMESNSQSFIDAIRCFYMPRLVQKIEQSSTNSTNPNCEGSSSAASSPSQSQMTQMVISPNNLEKTNNLDSNKDSSCSNNFSPSNISEIPDLPSSGSSDAFGKTLNSTGSSSIVQDDCYYVDSSNYDMDLASTSATDIAFSDCHLAGRDWLGDDMAEDGVWDLDELWQLGSKKDMGN